LDAWIAWYEPIAAAMRDANLPRDSFIKDILRYFRTDANKGTSLYDVLAGHRAAMAVVAMTRRFLGFVDEEKRRLGVVDFDDLLLRTLAVLDDPAVLARARAQFDYIFVDEFQDTDRVQARIIEALAKDAHGDFVPGRTVVVGDPKQSIYGFRRADPETYYRMTEALIAGGAERRAITEQYRSDPQLLEAVNAMFACLFPNQLHDPNVFRPAYRPLTAARTEPSRELDARFTLLRASASDGTNRYFAEATSIAEWINARRDGSGTDLQRYAILFRRLTELDDYLDTLDRHRIDYVLPPTRLFLDRRAPVDLLAVLRAIAFPHDRGALISAARTPYFALTDDEIAVGVLEVAETAWTAFVDSIRRFRDASRHLTVTELIDLLVDTTGIETLYRAASDGERHLRHLEHIRRIAFEYDQRSGGSVRQFVDEITDRRDDPDEMEPSLVDESRNAVRILTVHAAKGLEFDTVIVPDLGFDTKGGDGGVQFYTVEEPRSLVLGGRVESISGRFRHAPGGDPLRKIASQRQEAEMRRLFYVAVTRAKSEVVFVCNTDEKSQMKGFLKCLLEPLALKVDGLDALWPAEAGRVLHPMH
ncbi:MAG: UvrD-helicase domain-containing protein, partial [Thermoanaerobaculia bacterium]